MGCGPSWIRASESAEMTVPAAPSTVAFGRARVATAGTPLLEIHGLDVEFRTSSGPVRAVNGLDLDVRAGEMVGLVGESGSGKSVTSRAVMGLLPRRTTRIGGSIRLDGDELVGLPEESYRRIRGERVAMIFQDPMTALDPLYAAGEQVAEALRFHFELSSAVARDRVRDLFAQVGLSDPDKIARAYPHQLSGGMRQRVNLARALAVEPDILLMDEPFAALDAQTREMMQVELIRIWQSTKKTVLFVTHQLDEAVFMSDRVVALSARPGSVREIIGIDIPQPRSIDEKRTERFQGYVSKLWQLIEGDVRHSFQLETSLTKQETK